MPKKADDIIVRGLKTNFRKFRFIRESSDDYSRLGERYCFVVDPLDGTKEFINRNDDFTVNIALTECGLPVLGVIYVPVYDELYHAAKSLGAGLL